MLKGAQGYHYQRQQLDLTEIACYGEIARLLERGRITPVQHEYLYRQVAYAWRMGWLEQLKKELQEYMILNELSDKEFHEFVREMSL